MFLSVRIRLFSRTDIFSSYGWPYPYELPALGALGVGTCKGASPGLLPKWPCPGSRTVPPHSDFRRTAGRTRRNSRGAEPLLTFEVRTAVRLVVRCGAQGCPSVTQSTCTACSASNACTAVTCNSGYGNFDRNYKDGCEQACPSVTQNTCTTCSPASTCTAVTCNSRIWRSRRVPSPRWACGKESCSVQARGGHLRGGRSSSSRVSDLADTASRWAIERRSCWGRSREGLL